MSVEDPFFVVKSEVEKSVGNCRSLLERWRSLMHDGGSIKHDQFEKITNELRNNVRSIEWDLEDLDETIGIVEANPRKFKISRVELQERKSFITSTRKSIRSIKDEISSPEVKARLEDLSRKSLLRNGIHKTGYGSHQNGGYVNHAHSEFDIEGDENDRFIQDSQQQQRLLIEQQDDQLDLVADSVGILKNMSRAIGNELDEQSVMLEGLGHEMENTQSRMDTVLRKMATVTHMSNDRRQWCAIGVLGGSMFVVFLLFFLI